MQPHDGSPARLEYAGLWVRARAFLVDYVVIAAYLAVVVAIGAVSTARWPTVVESLFGSPLYGQLSGFCVVTLPVTLYFALMEASALHATLGKRALGLWVQRLDGGPLRFGRALWRTALKFVPWELAHACIWQARLGSDALAPIVYAGFAAVWGLVGLNAYMIARGATHQALYDRIAQTCVVVRRNRQSP